MILALITHNAISSAQVPRLTHLNLYSSCPNHIFTPLPQYRLPPHFSYLHAVPEPINGFSTVVFIPIDFRLSTTPTINTPLFHHLLYGKPSPFLCQL